MRWLAANLSRLSSYRLTINLAGAWEGFVEQNNPVPGLVVAGGRAGRKTAPSSPRDASTRPRGMGLRDPGNLVGECFRSLYSH